MENHEFQLPAEIIQQIQSLMPQKDAARTTLLSRSWYGAWCTLPNLAFKQFEFQNRMDEFPYFTKKTMQRYEDLNLKIQTFRLWMNDSHSLARELILKAIKLGAVDFSIEIRSFVLPDQVLESETLARLFVNGCTVDLQNMITTCSNLKLLKLSNAIVKNGDLVRDLISRCPLIEELIWDQPKNMNRHDRRIKLEKFDDKVEFHKLKYMRLIGLDVEDALYRHELCPKFPCLKELVIWDYFSNEVRICSPSLERITIRLLGHTVVNAEFDVPNIRKFKLSGSHVPRLVIKTCSEEWESDIDITYLDYEQSASWFSSLNQLVKMLSPSRVSLSISVDIRSCSYSDAYVGDGLPIPAVENLTLSGHDVSLTYLNSLLWSCRPNFMKIEKRCAFRMANELNHVESYKQLRSVPWKTLFDASKCQRGFLGFQLN